MYPGIHVADGVMSFSALQRAEIAEIAVHQRAGDERRGFSALQRAEIAEIAVAAPIAPKSAFRFSALQRAEIAEIWVRVTDKAAVEHVSVLFNEPKLLKFSETCRLITCLTLVFQCSSTSRNC